MVHPLTLCCPQQDYVHRIGRTGRKTNEGYNEGTAISFFTSSNSRLAQPLARIMAEAGQVIPPQLEAMGGGGYGGGGGRYGGGGGGRGGFGGGGGGRGGGYGGGFGGGGISGSNTLPLGPRR